jgi:hypothetical protein
MRIGWALGCILVACGNGSQSGTTATTPTASAPPTQTVATASASASTTPSATATETASATPPPAPMPTLQEILANAKEIKLIWRPKLDTNETKNLEIKTAATIKGLLDVIGPDQRPEGNGPGYMSTFDFKFVDKDGNPLATVSLFASPTMSDSNKKYGRINTADGKFGGIVVAKYADLQKKLKALGVDLP